MKQYFHLVDKSKYPLNIIVLKKKAKDDRSFFDLDSNKLTLKIDTSYQSEQEIIWLCAHEFFHFLQNNNPELSKLTFNKETEFLEKVLTKVLPESNGFDSHDLMIWEVGANSFATLIAGKFFRRHWLKKKNNNIK